MKLRFSPSESYGTYLQIDGRWCDHVLFGLTRERYDATRRG